MTTTLATALLLAALAAVCLARPAEAGSAVHDGLHTMRAIRHSPAPTPTPASGWTVVSLADGALD